MVQLRPDQSGRRIQINSQFFTLAEDQDVVVYPVNSESQAIRTIGLQQRQNNRKLNKLVRDWSDGLGYARLRRDTNRGINGLRDADAETRFSSMLTLPLNPQTQTHGSPADHLITYENFKGNLIGLFEEDYASDAIDTPVSRKFNASTDTWDTTDVGADPTFNGYSEGEASSGDGLTVSHTVSSNGGRLVVVWVIAGVAGDDSTSYYPSGVTFEGVAMTLLARETETQGRFAAYYLVNPPSGSGDAAASWAGDQSRMQMVVTDYYNVNIAAPFRSSGTDTGATGSLAVSITVEDDDLVIGAYGNVTGGAVTPGTNQTERVEIAHSHGTYEIAVSDERADGRSTSFDHSYTFDAGGSGLLLYGVLAGASSLIAAGGANATGVRVFGSTVHKGAIYVVGTDGDSEGAYSWKASSTGAAWSNAQGNGTNWPTSVYVHTDETRKNDWSNKYADILGFGTNLIAALYEDPDASGGGTTQVHVGYSANAGTTWTFHAGLVIPSGDTPNISLISARDIFSSNSETIPALVTSDNIYLLDIANNTYQTMLPAAILSGTANEALAAVHAADGAIYVSKASGDIFRIMIPSPGVIAIQNIGPHSKTKIAESDGLVAVRQGHANFMWGADPRWLFVAYGGHASGKNGSVFCFDYQTGTWHSFYKDATANRDTTRVIGSEQDDGVSRIHIATEAAAASVMQQFEEPYVSAGTGVTQQYRSTGYVEWAEDDLGDPHADSAILTVRLDADDLDDVSTIEGGSGTSTDVEIEYGVNGADWENVSTLGFFASDDLVLYLGKTNQNTPGASEAGTPVGVSAKTFRMRAELKRDGTATNTPKIKELQTEHVNKQAHLKGFSIAIDIGATALDQNIDPEVVDDRIDTIIESVTSVPLAFGEETDGTGTTYYVESMPTGNWKSEGVLPNAPGIGTTTERTKHVGIRTLTLEERIDV